MSKRQMKTIGFQAHASPLRMAGSPFLIPHQRLPVIRQAPLVGAGGTTPPAPPPLILALLLRAKKNLTKTGILKQAHFSPNSLSVGVLAARKGYPLVFRLLGRLGRSPTFVAICGTW